MKKRLLIVLLYCFTHALVQAQTPVTPETLRLLCNGPVFERAETMPKLIHGTSVYSDSLTAYMRAHQLAIPSGQLILRIAILATGDVQFVGVLDSTITAPGNLIDAVLAVRDQWKPATQNKYLVCCYSKLVLELSDDKIRVSVPERK